MTDHLFPESTTYIHSYVGHKGCSAGGPYRSPETRPYVYEDPLKGHGRAHDLAIGADGPSLSNSPETLRCSIGEPKPQKPKLVCSSVGNVELTQLQPADRDFFLAQTYRTTYGKYAKDEPARLVTKMPFTRRDDVMLRSLNSTKPNLANYGFGLPNKCCVAWSNVQSRTLPNDNRTCVSEKKIRESPFAGYPDKMYPHILTKELCPHYDGSFMFGYTGHQRRCLNYPDDVNAILRKDFPQHIPRALTTNQAKLAHLPIPMCETGQIN